MFHDKRHCYKIALNFSSQLIGEELGESDVDFHKEDRENDERSQDSSDNETMMVLDLGLALKQVP